jgi:predicted transcriptional regulator
VHRTLEQRIARISRALELELPLGGGLSQRKIARELGCCQGSVSRMLKRGRKAIRVSQAAEKARKLEKLIVQAEKRNAEYSRPPDDQ